MPSMRARPSSWSLLACLLCAPVLTACPGASEDEGGDEAGGETSSEVGEDADTEVGESSESGESDETSSEEASSDGESSESESTDSESSESEESSEAESSGTGGSTGCGAAPNVGSSVQVGGEERTFVLALPDNYDPDQAYPLVYAIHGLGGSGSLASNYFGLAGVIGDDAIVVYPDGLPLPEFGNQPGWNLMPQGNDVAFFDALHEALTTQLCVDEDRVFATGHSFGGYMSNSLGCYRGDRFAAIAPVAGGGPFFGACDGPMAVWITHGSADDVVELSEGLNSRDTWAELNGCDDGFGDVPPDGCVSYAGCEAALHWCEHPGGHEWPAFAPAAIWAFFEAQG